MSAAIFAKNTLARALNATTVRTKVAASVIASALQTTMTFVAYATNTLAFAPFRPRRAAKTAMSLKQTALVKRAAEA